jgi:hypothetical protein
MEDKIKEVLQVNNHKEKNEFIRLYDSRTLIAGCQWLTPVILAIQDAEIRRIMV